MVLQTQRFEGTPGAALTTAGSGFALVNPSGNARLTYQAPPAPEPYGGTVARIVAGAGEVNEGRFASGDVTAVAAQAIIYLTGHATGAVCDLIALRGTIQNAVVRARTDNTLTLLNAGSGDDLARRFTPPLNTWLVVDVRVAEGTTAANGTIAYRVRRLDDLAGTPLVDFAATNINAGIIGTDVINSHRIGKITSAVAVVPTFYLAAFDVDDGATAYLPDPTWPDPTPARRFRYSPDGTTTAPAAAYYSPDGTNLTPLDIT